jgi:hypothetical protein
MSTEAVLVHEKRFVEIGAIKTITHSEVFPYGQKQLLVYAIPQHACLTGLQNKKHLNGKCVLIMNVDSLPDYENAFQWQKYAIVQLVTVERTLLGTPFRVKVCYLTPCMMPHEEIALGRLQSIIKEWTACMHIHMEIFKEICYI